MLKIKILTSLFLSAFLLLNTDNTQAQIVVDAGNDTTFCGSGSATLGGNPTMTGGTPPISYTWTPSTGLSNPSAANPVATVSSTTTYIVSTTDFNGRGGKDTVTITVLTASNVTLDPFPPLCEYDSIQTLDQGNPAGGVYSGNGIVASPRFNPALAGSGQHTITYTYTNTACSTSFSATRSIWVNPAPTLTTEVKPDSVCLEDTAILKVSGADSYLWSPSQGLNISSGDSVLASQSTSGEFVYFVEGIIDTTGCSRVDSVILLVVPCIPGGMEDGSMASLIDIYPNPANEILNLNNRSNSITKLIIYDMEGRKIMQETIYQGVNAIYLNEFKSGLYYIQLISSNGLLNKKLLITK